MLTEGTFMDDAFDSQPTIESAAKVALDAINIMKEINFDLIGFQSNAKEILKQLPLGDVKEELLSCDPDKNSEYITKVLGMYWDPKADEFTYRANSEVISAHSSSQVYRPTKRELLRIVMKVFDPLGLLAYYTIREKIIMQEVWRDGTRWDDEIDARLTKMWSGFIEQLSNLQNVRLPRQYSPVNPDDYSVELHIFVDASELAYAAYFRFERENIVDVSLVIGKARVIPLKSLSIPQAELMAATMGVRLANTIKELHRIRVSKTIYWSDSRVVIAWINSSAMRYKQFVGLIA